MTRTRRNSRGAAAAACLFATLLAGCGAEETRAVPQNLLVVVLDTLRPDHLGCYGYERETSAHLDALADAGVVLENLQSAAPWTGPSLISIMTGLYPAVHQVSEFPRPRRMPADVTTLAEELRELGLATAAFTEGGFAGGGLGLADGFDTFAEEWGDEELGGNRRRFDSRIERNLALALEWLEANHERPFFLFFHTYEPHTPYHPEPEHLSAILPDYDTEKERAALREAIALWRAGKPLSDAQWLHVARHFHHCELAPARAELHAGLEDPEEREAIDVALWEELLERGYGRTGGEQIPRLVPFLRALYDAEIRYADEQLARLFARLEELGHGEDTLVVVLSDHGEAFWEHGLLGHGLDLHEEVLRVVGILRGPGLERARARVPELSRTIDIMPTVLELFGRDPDRLPLQGRSLLPLLRGEVGELPAFSGSTTPRREEDRTSSLRTERWRYVAAASGPERWLYDLRADPGETRDVRAEHPRVAERLEQLLRDQRRRNERLGQRFRGEKRWPELDEDTLRDLRGLGYLESGEE